MLASSRGGFDLEKIIDFLQRHDISQVIVYYQYQLSSTYVHYCYYYYYYHDYYFLRS